MSDIDAEACSLTDKLPNHSNDLLHMIWKMMQEDKIEQERIRQETEEKQAKIRREDKAESERNRKEDKERLEQLIKQIKDDVEQIKEGLVQRCEDRASKLAADNLDPEKKTQHSIVEINNKIHSVEEIQCQ